MPTRKKVAIISVLFIIVISLIIGYYCNSSRYKDIKHNSSEYIDIKDMPDYIIKKKIVNGSDIQIRLAKDVDNKHLILFTYTGQGITEPKPLIELACFKKMPNCKYIFERVISENQLYMSTQILETNDVNGNEKNYTLLFGYIPDSAPTNKYKIVSKGIEHIEIFPRNVFYIKEIPLIKGYSTDVTPVY